MKELRELSTKEYFNLKEKNILNVLYEDATGDYLKDMGKKHPCDLFQIGDCVYIDRVNTDITDACKVVDIYSSTTSLIVTVELNGKTYNFSDVRMLIRKA